MQPYRTRHELADRKFQRVTFTKKENVMGKLFVGCLSVIMVLALMTGGSALMAYVGELLFNFIAVQTQHPGAQISFWVAWAAMFLLGLIAAPFRSSFTATKST